MPELRPYQIELLEQTRQAYRDGYHSPCIVLPCGGGKSCIVAEMARSAVAQGGHPLFLVHRQELVAQLRQTLTAWGVPLDGADVMMVQTAVRRTARIAPPSLIVTDENHHCLAASYRKIYEAFPGVPLVGVTATPQRLNGGGLGDVNDALVVGPSAKWLIENHYLAPYDYYAPSVADLTGIRSARGEYVAADIEARLNKAAIHGDVIENYRKYGGDRQAIVYCASIPHSKAVADAFEAAGYPARHIDGDTTDSERQAAVQAFRDGDLRVLCNVDLISEGFDVPDCGCAILLRPTKSLTLFIQQSMRCMRYREGKRAVIIDAVGNYARFGLPDADREWSLDPKPAAKREQAASVHTCPECFGAFDAYVVDDADVRQCPYCGYEMPVKARSVEEIKAAQLERIEGFVLKYTNPGQCRSYEELRAYAKRKGYKPGWAWYQAKHMGYARGMR